MHPFMTPTTKRDDVGLVEPERWISSPGSKVVNMEPSPAFVWRSTSLAMIIVPLVDAAKKCLVFPLGIKSLPLWGTAVNVIWIQLTSPSSHAVSGASKVWFWLRRLFAEFFPCGRGMTPALEWIDGTRRFHVVVRTGKVVTSRSGDYSKVLELFVNTLRISAYKFCYVVSRKFLNDILFRQPGCIEVHCFHVKS